jgi:hypothetical protein
VLDRYGGRAVDAGLKPRFGHRSELRKPNWTARAAGG